MPDAPITRLRTGLEAAVLGQEDAVTGLLLAFLAREHAYLEGPPGCGKTALAEALARVSGAPQTAIRFHRDLRETDLLGDARIRREPAGRGGERVRREVEPGPLLQAELAVLDDLSRAPGEALGPLLRILSDRRALGTPLPLATAIATAPPADAPEVYADPLEPNQLDRFAVQIRMQGLVMRGAWSRARDLLGQATRSVTAGRTAPLSRVERVALWGRVAALPIADAAQRGWCQLLERLARIAQREGGALLSDRAFGVAGPHLMRAHAVLRDAPCAQPADLRVLRFMVARRLPDAILEVLEPLISEVIEAVEPAHTQPREEREFRAETATGEGEGGDAEPRGGNETTQTGAARTSEEPAHVEAAEVAPLLRVLRGRLDRGRLDREEDPGGSPRRVRPLRRFDELLDADPVEVQLLVEGALHGMPRTAQREKPLRGGALVLLRDVSASMEGHFARWSGSVVAGLVRAAARRRMRVGYIEFNHQAQALQVGDRLLHRHYREVLTRAAIPRAVGRTNYEAPLVRALEALGEHRGSNRHIVMLTDGVPVLGDPVVGRERAAASRLGVRIHTVFLGKGDCPAVLDQISTETDGMRFRAEPDATGRICVAERRGRGVAA